MKWNSINAAPFQKSSRLAHVTSLQPAILDAQPQAGYYTDM